jgi:hypothetical protein
LPIFAPWYRFGFSVRMEVSFACTELIDPGINQTELSAGMSGQQSLIIASPVTQDLAVLPGSGKIRVIFTSAMPVMYTQCPKCGHILPQPLPDSAACPACGIYFFKYSQFQSRHESVLTDMQTMSSSYNLHDFAEALLRPMDKIDEPTFYGRCIVFVLLALWGGFLFAYDYRDGEINASFMHNILLPIHEAGHVVFMPFGDFMHILGGSLFQLLLPFGIGIAFFWINKDNFGAAIGMWWGSTSLLDLAPYIYDARHPQLILLGGHTGEDGPHDWIYLLTVLGQLHNSQAWGTSVHTLGGIVMFVALSWAMAVLWRQRLMLEKYPGDK